MHQTMFIFIIMYQTQCIGLMMMHQTMYIFIIMYQTQCISIMIDYQTMYVFNYVALYNVYV